MSIRNFLDRTKTFIISSLPGTPHECPTPSKPTKSTLFPVVDPAIDGEDCLHDCASCPVEYPRAFTKIGINEDDELWGRDVEDEKGSVMMALGKEAKGSDCQKLMISASNMLPPPEYYVAEEQNKPMPTTVLILPSFIEVTNVTPEDTPELIRRFVYSGPMTRTPLTAVETATPAPQAPPSPPDSGSEIAYETPAEEADLTVSESLALRFAVASLDHPPSQPTQIPLSINDKLSSHPCPHSLIVLLCSHKRRDARCGISAPILAREFERHLRPLGLHRDLSDTRPGGVGLYFINHIGGHKYSANVLIYRKEDGMGVWLARVAPKHVEGIVKYTICQGKIVNPDMIRGGFYRKTGAVSW
ncbi:Sucrase/ferredoxin-like-domain-containing protein [Terfezia claveryi]|nr:Sucrase/ferredoxin-like-domain-containing protein [Terfezia claveryi]